MNKYLRVLAGLNDLHKWVQESFHEVRDHGSWLCNWEWEVTNRSFLHFPGKRAEISFTYYQYISSQQYLLSTNYMLIISSFFSHLFHPQTMLHAACQWHIIPKIIMIAIGIPCFRYLKFISHSQFKSSRNIRNFSLRTASSPYLFLTSIDNISIFGLSHLM